MLKESANDILVSLGWAPRTEQSMHHRFACCGLARGTARLGAPGLGGWEVCLFEHPAGTYSSFPKPAGQQSSAMPKWFFRSLLV